VVDKTVVDEVACRRNNIALKCTSKKNKFGSLIKDVPFLTYVRIHRNFAKILNPGT
jgi:hypothetical protein